MIALKNVKKRYGGNLVFTNLNLLLDEPKIVGLVGRNGSGKSTLMQMIAGLLRPTKGNVEVFGFEAYDQLEVSINTLYVHDRMAFSPTMTLHDICKLGDEFYLHWDQTLVEKLLAFFGLNAAVTYKSLSMGMRTTFNVIFGLASRAAITLFDEPVNGVDEGIREQLYRAILKDYIAKPRMIIISSHLLDEMEHLLEEIIILNNGEIIEHENITNFTEKYCFVEGEETILRAYFSEKSIFKKSALGYSRVFTTVKQAKNICNNELKILPVSAREAYLLLTEKQRGDIDDIFAKI